MNFRLITLAALAGLAGTASAQNVTIYGLVDLSVQHLKSGSQSPLAGKSMTRLADGTTYGPGSRWGIRVDEDLGGGMKAAVTLEGGFFADTGGLAQGGRGFGRQAFISLSSASAGELRLGRQYILHDELIGMTSPAGGVTALNPGGVYTLAGGTVNVLLDAPRLDNAVHYLSPVFGGFRVQAMVAPGEGTADRYMGLKATYTSGPLAIGAVHERSKARAGSPSTVNKITEIAASYDLGFVKLFSGYQQGKDLTTGVGTQIGTLRLPGLPGVAVESRTFSLGVSKQFGQLNAGLAYASNDFENAAGTSRSLGRYGAVATYSLSKRTALYGALAFANGDLKEAVNEKQVVQFGVRHSF